MWSTKAVQISQYITRSQWQFLLGRILFCLIVSLNLFTFNRFFKCWSKDVTWCTLVFFILNSIYRRFAMTRNNYLYAISLPSDIFLPTNTLTWPLCQT